MSRKEFVDLVRIRIIVLCICIVCVCVLFAQSCLPICDTMDCSLPGFSQWDSLGKNTGVNNHSLLQRIFLTQELNPGLLHSRQILYCLCH